MSRVWQSQERETLYRFGAEGTHGVQEVEGKVRVYGFLLGILRTLFEHPELSGITEGGHAGAEDSSTKTRNAFCTMLPSGISLRCMASTHSLMLG